MVGAVQRRRSKCQRGARQKGTAPRLEKLHQSNPIRLHTTHTQQHPAGQPGTLRHNILRHDTRLTPAKHTRLQHPPCVHFGVNGTVAIRRARNLKFVGNKYVHNKKYYGLIGNKMAINGIKCDNCHVLYGPVQTIVQVPLATWSVSEPPPSTVRHTGGHILLMVVRTEKDRVAIAEYVAAFHSGNGWRQSRS